MIFRRAAGVLLAAVSLFPAFAQKLDPIQWTFTPNQKAAPGGQIVGHLTAKLDEGWHLYSPTTPPGGPIPTTLKLDDNTSISSYSVYQPKPDTKFDPNFNLNVEWFENQADFIVVADVSKTAAAGPLELTAQVRYQACNDRLCLPPRKKSAALTVTIDASATATAFTAPAGYSKVVPGVRNSSVGTVPATAPVPKAAESEGLGQFLLIAFGFGLAAIFTPCVFPMIPITMSFFLNQQSGSRRQGLMQALVFCLGIIFLFSALGFAVTAVAGPFGVVQLGSNPWVNGFIAAGVFRTSD